MKEVRNKDLAIMNGKMDQFSKVNGIKTNLMVRAFTHGLMVEHMMGNGRTVKCMALESILGKMVEFTKDSIPMIKKKVKVFTLGMMVVNMMVSGKKVSNMVQVFTQ